MKKMSIKLFTIIVMIVFLTSEGVIYYNFFMDSKKTTETLLENNIKVNILNIKHFLDKNLKDDNINQIRAYLDNIVYANNIIKNIRITDDHNLVLYSTDREFQSISPTNKCIPISHIQGSNIYNQTCYTFSIKLFHGLEPYYFKADVYLNQKYLSSLVNNKIAKYLTFSFTYLIIFIFIFWIISKKVIINPLKNLRQFAYYSDNIPKKFFITELESIRYSLDFTFKRLKEEQAELFNLSTKDSLSGLYNRLSLIEKITWLISESKRLNSKFAVLFLDLDNFKDINDSHGHEFGDKVLKYVSKTLLKSVRDNDIVSRLGGDEFVVVLPTINGDESILEVLWRIQQELSVPVIFNDYKYQVTTSIGITIYPKDGEDVTSLLKNADIAMYKSKALGKNNFHFFTETLHEEIQNKIHIQRVMYNAFDKNYFQLFYQPKVDIKTNEIVGCEALIRLVDPEHGIILPNKFIPFAEENNFIIPLGKWIIKTAIKQLKAWEETPLKDIKLSINVSGVQFKNTELLDDIKNAIKNINPSKLDIELTESVLINDFDKKLLILEQIRELGITLSLDDFGTGYSSLSYLKTIPFNTLKIDKSFIDNLENEKDQSFVNMIITIAQDLDLEVVAEGVENKIQLDYLQSINCEQYQGYYYSKPLPVKEFEALFLSHTSL